MADEAPRARAEQVVYPFELGTKVRFDLPSPCIQVAGGLQCLSTEGFIEVVPFQSSYDFKQSCANGHYVRHVKRPEVELMLGIETTRNDGTAVRDALSPSRRTELKVILRDEGACVFCGCRVGEEGLDGRPLIVSADHIIPKRLIDPAEIRRDGELLFFAREIQLVTACQSHSSAKQHVLLPLQSARNIFVRHVLKNETRGMNLGKVSTFERLYHLAARNERLRKENQTPTS